MNIDELKNEWSQMNDNIERMKNASLKAGELNLRNNSQNRINQLLTKNKLLSLLFAAELLVISAIFWGNPFDFTFQWQFFPFAILGLVIGIAFFRSLHTLSVLTKLDSGLEVSHFLNRAIEHFDKIKLFNHWLRLSFPAAGICALLSFIPNLTKEKDFASIIPLILLLVGISWGIYWLVFKSGWIHREAEKQLKEDLKDWETLKSLV